MSVLTAQVGNDITVKIAEKTDYPFEEKIDFNLSFPSTAQFSENNVCVLVW